MNNRNLGRGLYLLTLHAACGGHVGNERASVGMTPTAGPRGGSFASPELAADGGFPSGTLPGASMSGTRAIQGNSAALTAHVEDNQKLTIDVITLACAGDCADIEAVAQGGNPPYTFVWEDGETSARRHVCLGSNAILSVNAHDTALSLAEFEVAAQTAMARVTANVLSCPAQTDAGAPPPACTKPPLSSFEAELKWAYAGPPNEPNCMVTPLVANLTDDNGDGKIDMNDTPDIVLVTGATLASAHLSVLDGATGKVHFTVAQEVSSLVTPALGDLDGDGTPEIVTINAMSQIVVLRHDGTLAYTSAETTMASTGGAMAIANLDGQGAPEIIAPSAVFDAQARKRWEAQAPVGSPEPVPVDLDGDGKLELLIGSDCYRFDGTPYFKFAGSSVNPRTAVAIANLNDDPEPEVLVSDSGGLAVLAHDGTVQRTLPKDILVSGYPMFVFDVDGDGASELGVPQGDAILLLRRDVSIVWSASTNDPSGYAGATAFDLLGTGKAQIMLADEQAFHVWDSAGKELFNVPRSSNTSIEYPVIADVDNDGAAEILIVSDRLGKTSDIPPLRVFHDPHDRWMPARRIWNESAYHVTNVDEDGTIPLHEQPSWKALNTFRAQAGVCTNK